MTKIRWHKRSETKGIEGRTKQEVSIFSLKEDGKYQSFAHKNVQLFVAESAIHTLKSHLFQDISRETGGILVGNVSVDSQENIYYTEITGAITAPTTIGNRSTFRFTPNCWTAIFKEQKEFYPQTQIVGWYHSHPNFGVFLSGVDLETQHDCFNQPWHIAVVYDPIRDEIGFFSGAKGEKMKSAANQPLQPRENSQSVNADEDEPKANSSEDSINVISSTEEPENMNANEDDIEASSSQDNITLLSAVRGIFIGFKIIFTNLIHVLLLLIRGILSLLRLFGLVIDLILSPLKGFNNFPKK